MSRRRGAAVVLFSGGLDSLVTLDHALRKGWTCYPLCFDYGQTNRREIEAARAQVAWLAPSWRGQLQPLRIATLPFPDLCSSGMMEGDDRGVQGYAETVVPGRNAVFVALAGVYACRVGARDVFLGIQNGVAKLGDQPQDRAIPDASEEFVDDMRHVLRSYFVNETWKVRLRAPLLWHPKRRILRAAQKRGLPVSLTWSCFENGDSPCGTCPACDARECAA